MEKQQPQPTTEVAPLPNADRAPAFADSSSGYNESKVPHVDIQSQVNN